MIRNLVVQKMPTDIEDLTSKLIQLPKRQRLEIARFLLFLDSQPPDFDDATSSWEAEIAARIRAVKDGSAASLDYSEAMRKVRARFMQ
jgi:hypothetical protein